MVRAERRFKIISSDFREDRCKRQKMHDLIALSHVVGSPGIFLTISSNPKGRDITQFLFTGRLAEVGVELSARVFRMQLRARMPMVLNDDIFGNILAHIRLIECQKRWSPHACCIFFQYAWNKGYFWNSLRVDESISAELLRVNYTELQKGVSQNAAHILCAELNTEGVCIVSKELRRMRIKSSEYA